ncbi:hypothetical protein BDN72DRAFT_849316 [Pluteus cervinus]|uniref:Uncharacterized protein n=1 Tax=Pluteus cervinus TaxID=181527 RepID=A0ACD3A818_9AGAR|nr:hypothetical protein BDN72DRAFT_849316 [Pluteus cervinus]
MSVVPHLPAEIQDQIFEIAATESLRTATTLVQVSKWLSHRIEPILYEIVVVKHSASPGFYPPHIGERTSNLLDFFERHGRHIRCLMIGSLAPKEHVIPALRLCPFLKNLISTIQYTAEMIEAVQMYLPHLERLSGKFEDTHTSFDASKQTYRGLTHLDLIGDFVVWKLWASILIQLPSLTHLAMNDPYLHDWESDEMAVGALQNCTRLQVLLLVSEHGDMENACREELDFDSTDDRVVVVAVNPLMDWLNGVRGGLDMWSLADQRVLERRRKRDVIQLDEN